MSWTTGSELDFQQGSSSSVAVDKSDLGDGDDDDKYEKHLKAIKNSLPTRYKITLVMHQTNTSALILATDFEDNRSQVFIKVETKLEKFKSMNYEATVYRLLNRKDPNCEKFPKMMEANIGKTLKDGDTFRFIVLQEEGMSLEKWHKQKGKLHSNLLAKIAVNLLDNLEFLHKLGFIHRDIHPGHVLITPDLKLKLIDFSFAKQYLKNDEHVLMKVHNISNSFQSYCSGNLEERSLSRKDDLEMVALMLIDLKRSHLPWAKGAVSGKSKTDKRCYMKEYRFESNKTEETLAKLPDVFGEFLEYCRNLEFVGKPNYSLWKQKFSSLIDC